MGTLGGTARAARSVTATALCLAAFSLAGCPSEEGGVSPTCTDELFTACNVNADCCAWGTREAYCVEGACVPTCSANSDCLSECCAASDVAEVDVCWLQSACGQCIFDFNGCTRNDDCCGWDDTSICFNSGEFPAPFGQCLPLCETDADCDSDCCIGTDLGSSVCAPASFCDEALCDDTCEFAMDGECDDGGPGSMFDVCDLGTDCSDCGPRPAP